MDENHFRRIEKKYLISKSDKEILITKIKDHIKKDKYFKSQIHNIYFDTPNNDLIINSLEKPLFKDKFRLRSYGIPTLDSEVYLEIKMKYKDIVGKRRVKIKLKDYYDFLNNKHIKIDNQIFKEFNYYYEYYKLKPTIYIAYDRISYLGKEDNNLRITFDNNLRSRRNNLDFNNNSKMNYFFDDDTYIMEIKTLEGMPLWLANALSEMKIFPNSFSKYGKIYTKEKNKEMIKYA